eukprot:Skav221644  [mRNA]  locus=scaffold1174:107584:112122:- [translate_table: standard]
MTLKDEHLRILAAGDRHLMVRISKGPFRLRILVLHAPTSEDELAAVQWWRTLPAVLSVERTVPLIVCMDANARLGSLISRHVGGHQPDEETLAGEALHELLAHHDLYLPQTFAHLHEGEGTTWVHSSGKESRIDFVAVDGSMFAGVRASKVMDVDISLSRVDHKPVLVEVEVGLPTPQRLRTIAPQARGPHSARLCAAGDVAAPCPHWSVDVHSHAVLLQQWLKARTPGPGERGPRKSHLSATTWTAVKLKQFHLRQLRRLRGLRHAGACRALWSAWKQLAQGRSTAGPDVHQGWLRQIDHAAAWHLASFQAIAPQVTKMLRADDKAYYEHLARSCGLAADEGLPGLWKSIKPMLPRQQQKRAHSMRCTGPAHADLEAHFAQLEAGEPVSYDALLSQCFASQAALVHEAPLEISLEQIPTRISVEHMALKMQRGKAPGLDAVDTRTLQNVMGVSSDAIYHLFFKSWLCAAEPLGFKGGLVFPIAKRAGRLSIQNVRGIVLLASLGKLYHATIRAALLPSVMTAKLDTQFGGFCHQQVSFASLTLQCYTRLLASHQLTQATIFIDVRHAFHSLLRNHAFGTALDATSSALRTFLEAEGFDFEAVMHAAGDHADHFDASTPDPVARVVREAHDFTWYTLGKRGSQYGCVRTHRGSRPGSPLADLAYNRLMVTVLEQVRNIVMADPDVTAVAAHLQQPPPIIAWVDDIAIPLACFESGSIDALVTKMLDQIIGVFRSFGLRVNLGPGKTETVIQYRGKSSTQCQRQLLFENFSTLTMPSGEPLRVVAKYQHLGSHFAQKLSIQAEINIRLGKASTAYRSLSRGVFGNKHIAIRVRLQLLESLVLPIIFFGSGTWPLLSGPLYRRLEHAILAWQRRIASDGHWKGSSQTSDAAFQAKWRLPSLSLRLARHRTMLAFNMMHHAPACLTTLISAEDQRVSSSWLEALRHALRWQAFELEGHALAGKQLTTEEIFTWLASSTRKDVLDLRALTRKTLLQEATIHEVAAGYESIVQICQRNGITLTELDTAPVYEAHLLRYPCDCCDQVFKSIQGLSAHRWRKHGRLSAERRFMDSATCLACGQCLWTTRRLQQHLHRSRARPGGCYEILVRRFDAVDEPARVGPRDLPDHLQHALRLPAVRAAGPVYIPDTTPWQRAHAARLASLQQRWAHEGLPATLDEDLASTIALGLTEVTWHWTHRHGAEEPGDMCLAHEWLNLLEPFFQDHGVSAVWAFLQWGRTTLMETLPEMDVDVQPYVDDQFWTTAKDFPAWELLDQRDSLDHAREPEPVSVQLPEPVGPDGRSPQLREPFPCCFADQMAFLRPYTDRMILDTSGVPLGVPVVRAADGRHHVFILHMFAGRRRVGDCHFWAEHYFKEFFPDEAFVLHMLSVDTAIDEQLCNILGPNYRYIAQLAAAGVFCLNLAGPPCETWTSARHLRLDAGEEGVSTGPRPLRSASRAWGVHGLTVGETRQLQTGTSLMMKSFETDSSTIEERLDCPFSSNDITFLWITGSFAQLLRLN